MRRGLLRLLAFVACGLFAGVVAECMNGCTGHGKCTVWDMCICDRNWQANDCSERTCPFNLAWFDTPKGDLDGSGFTSGPDEVKVVNSAMYPYGTTESFPNMVDSDHNTVGQSAHDYAECSNAGICDRGTGTCDCMPGFEGASCQRMSCPTYHLNLDSFGYHVYEGECSGHGVCRTLRQAAKADHNTRYKLWDKDHSTACVCDAGYFGGDCHQRSCKKELDPLYLDDVTPMQYGRYYFPLLTTASDATFHNGAGSQAEAAWSIVYYDQLDQPWETHALSSNADCDDIVAALEGLPNGLIPADTVSCQKLDVFELNPQEVRPKWEFRRQSRYTGYISGPRQIYRAVRPTFWLQGFDATYNTNSTSKSNPTTAATTDKYISGKIFHLEFLGNYGDLKEPHINIHTDPDSARATLEVDKGHLFTNVWSDGNRVEGTNYWSNHCHGVTVGIKQQGDYTYLTGFGGGMGEKTLLKKCLGGADHDDSNNGDFSNADWDHGSETFPHVVRLVRTVTDVTDSGFYVPIIYDTTTTGLDVSDPGLFTDGTFKLLIPFEGLDRVDYIDETTDKVEWEVYTTKGVVQRVGNQTEIAFDFASKKHYTTNVEEGTLYDGNVACKDSGKVTAYQKQNNELHACLNKGDMFFVFDPVNKNKNPSHINLYKATAVYSEDTLHRGDEEKNGMLGYADAYQYGEYQRVLSRYKTHVVESDIATNWMHDAIDGSATFYMYKFFPHVESTYNYVAECSNRGLCNTFEGTCECFPGYTGDGCREQEALTL